MMMDCAAKIVQAREKKNSTFLKWSFIVNLYLFYFVHGFDFGFVPDDLLSAGCFSDAFCKISIYLAANAASSCACISDVVGNLYFSPVFFTSFMAASSPIPVNEDALVRFALR